METFFSIYSNIQTLHVPFGNIFTSVYLVDTPKGFLLCDTATTEEDVTDCILPALGALGITPHDLCGVFLTHHHGDHAGGLPTLLAACPDLPVYCHANAPSRHMAVTKQLVPLSDDVPFCDILRCVHLDGHTDDCAGVLDSRTGTLLCGDGIQQYGVAQYVCYLEYPDRYEYTLKKVKSDHRIRNLIFSHDYEPFGETAFGVDVKHAVLDECLDYLLKADGRNNKL